MRRDAQICVLRARRRSWPEIAKEVGVSTRSCERVWRDYLAGREAGLVEQGPDSIVFEAIEEIDALADKMARLGEDAKDNPSVMIGSAKVQEKLLMDKIHLMQATGLLPNDLGVLRHVHDVRIVVSQIVEILREHDVPIAVQREIAKAIPA